MLRITSGGIRGALTPAGGFGARGLLGRADQLLTKELKIVRTAEVALSGFTFGMIQGRFKSQGGMTLAGLPVDLVAGAALQVLSLFNFARPYASHLRAVGDGALASFFTTTGYRVGERWGSGGSLMKGLSGMFGDAAPAGGSSIADQELANLVRAG